MLTITNKAFKTALVLPFLTLAACDQAPEPSADLSSDPPAPALSEADVSPNGTVIEVAMADSHAGLDGPPVQFEPRIIIANVGDTVRFIPSSPDQEASSIPTMLPEGVQGFDAEPGEVVSYVIPEPGIYGFQCEPHYAAGSVGIIIARGEGEEGSALENLSAAKLVDHPGRANPEFFEIFSEAERQGLLE